VVVDGNQCPQTRTRQTLDDILRPETTT